MKNPLNFSLWCGAPSGLPKARTPFKTDTARNPQTLRYRNSLAAISLSVISGATQKSLISPHGDHCVWKTSGAALTHEKEDVKAQSFSLQGIIQGHGRIKSTWWDMQKQLVFQNRDSYQYTNWQNKSYWVVKYQHKRNREWVCRFSLCARPGKSLLAGEEHYIH